MSVGEGLTVPSDQLPTARALEKRLPQLLAKASQLKPDTTIEPPLRLSDFEDDVLALSSVTSAQANGTSVQQFASQTDNTSRQQSASTTDHGTIQSALETAARNIFYPYIFDENVTSPAFITIWNLLDILQFCSDLSQSDCTLHLNLIEELLESQTIEGCKHVLHYMDSRRDRLLRLPRDVTDEDTRTSMTRRVQMALLKSCNELLRRLSRAEDTVFCGKVFIFLFQSFPLGDKSSVNLRGEFHTDNVTSFDAVSKPKEEEPKSDAMQVDQKTEEVKEDKEATPATNEAPKGAPTGPKGRDAKNVEKQGQQKAPPKEEVDIETLYTVFWSLQQYFSNPTKLFARADFDAFKRGLALTLDRFKSVPKIPAARGFPKVQSQHPESAAHRGTKRKRGVGNNADPSATSDAFASTFNPKYLTSRDLFSLELSDLTFQRHILVQALIVIDFLLSLTPKAKEKVVELKPQKAMLYDFTLGEEDNKWATDTRSAIAAYLSEGPDGRFYYRMADTVLSRDKNWVRWKMEQCPPISKPAVPTSDQMEAVEGMKRVCANRRMKANPMGAIDLSFVSDTHNVNGLETLKGADKCRIDGPERWVREAEQIDLDLEMAADPEEEAYLKEGRTTASWRALRVAGRRRFAVLDKVDEASGLEALKKSDEAVAEQTKGEEAKAEADGAVDGTSDVKMEGAGEAAGGEAAGEAAETTNKPEATELEPDEAAAEVKEAELDESAQAVEVADVGKPGEGTIDKDIPALEAAAGEGQPQQLVEEEQGADEGGAGMDLDGVEASGLGYPESAAVEGTTVDGGGDGSGGSMMDHAESVR